MLSLVLPAVVAAGCLGAADDECYRAEPTAYWLSFVEPIGATPEVDQPLNVYVQLHEDPGAICHDDPQGICSCTDSPPRPTDFAVIDARCPQDDCTVVSIGSYVAFGVGLSVVPTSEAALLEVTVASIGATAADEALATDTYRIRATP